MSLQFIGPGGSFEMRWIVYAVLRDSVQHHLEQGQKSPEFACVHEITKALGGRRVRVPADALQQELLQVRSALYGLPREEAAISQETQAIVSGTWPGSAERTILLSELAPGAANHLDPAARTLGEVLSPLVEPLLAITENAVPGDMVEVNDL